MKTTIISILLAFTFLGCSRDENDPSNNATIGINSISGLYKGGTLTWVTLNLSNGTFKNGTDPHATFDIKFLGNDNITITVISTAPLPVKSFNAKLISKSESNPTAVSYMGSFFFEHGNRQVIDLNQNGTYGGASIFINKAFNEVSYGASLSFHSMTTNTILTSFDLGGGRN